MTCRKASLVLKEVMEETKAVERTINAVSRSLEELSSHMHPAGFTYFTGSGTSYHASIVGQYAMASFASSPASSVPASEFTQWVSLKGRDTLVVAISRSGETVETLEAAGYARSQGATVLALTNTPRSSLIRISHAAILTDAGEEESGVATKSYVSQLVALYLFSAFIGGVKGREGAAEFKRVLYELPGKVEETISASEKQAKRIAEKYFENEFFFVLGSGPNYATALEAALKLKEVAGVFAEGFSTRDFLHGPMQLVDEKTPIIIFLPHHSQADACIEATWRLKKLGPPVITVSDQESQFEDQLLVPACDPLVSPILFIIPLHLLSYHLFTIREEMK